MIRSIVLLLCAILFAATALAQPDGLERRTITAGGVARSYYVHEPARTWAGPARPAVLVLHGGGGNGKISAAMSGFNQKADAEGFVAVYPNGSGRFGEDRLLTWNAGHCCAYALRERVKDVAFISELIDELVRRDRVDPKRIYVTGMSNGGMMSFVLGRELSHKIAAIAPVVGAMFGDEAQPSAPMPVIMFNSRTDKSVPFEGGPAPVRMGTAVADADIKPTMFALDFWARANRCVGPPAVANEPGVTITRFDRCAGGARVVLYALEGGGHSWPGGRASGRAGADEPDANVSATDLMWDFFKQHSR
jgi:polyhydroxybutyrate depolymerase